MAGLSGLGARREDVPADLNPCKCGRGVVLAHSYHDYERGEVAVAFHCSVCGEAHKSLKAWNAANPLLAAEPAPRPVVSSEPLEAALRRAAESLRELGEILERIAAVPR